MIINVTKGLVLSKTHKSCSSFFSKARGLMFSSPKVLVFEFEKERKRLRQEKGRDMRSVHQEYDIKFREADRWENELERQIKKLQRVCKTHPRKRKAREVQFCKDCGEQYIDGK